LTIVEVILVDLVENPDDIIISEIIFFKKK
jgi:predicted RNA-binding protein YlqC (UPF0109 family)